MRKINIKIFLIVLFVIINCSFLILNCPGQWIYQHQLVLGQFLMDVEFINKTTGWVCGSGVILKTTNAGVNWEYQTHPATNKSLYSIQPLDSNIAYCVGYFETILKTTNGGENWFAIRNGPYGQGKSYKALFFINEFTGWICGATPYILNTTDGGISFDSTYFNYYHFNDLYFKDSNTGIMVGDGAGIYKTTNGGINWIQASLPPSNYGNIYKLSVIQNTYCFAVETGKRIIKTTNFGDNWDIISFIAQSEFPYCCTFSSINTGWVGGSYGQVFKTTNGGLYWQMENTGGDQRPLNSFWFYNDTIGWGVGSSGKIIYTTTSGLTFTTNYSKYFPNKFYLFQNYPNPFNYSTIIEYEIIETCEIKLSLYDIFGRMIRVLDVGKKTPGVYRIEFTSNELATGIYYYELIINQNQKIVKKMILLK